MPMTEPSLSEVSDDDLIEECLRRAHRGGLVLRREVVVGGFRHDPASYQLRHVGPPPKREDEHPF
jgi:hypothetical protein